MKRLKYGGGVELALDGGGEWRVEVDGAPVASSSDVDRRAVFGDREPSALEMRMVGAIRATAEAAAAGAER